MRETCVLYGGKLACPMGRLQRACLSIYIVCHRLHTCGYGGEWSTCQDHMWCTETWLLDFLLVVLCHWCKHCMCSATMCCICSAQLLWHSPTQADGWLVGMLMCSAVCVCVCKLYSRCCQCCGDRVG